MFSLVATYEHLGRKADAIAMAERLLEFNCRVLPENDPFIGEGDLWYIIACFDDDG